MYDIPAMVQALLDAISDVAKCRTTEIENQSTTEVIEDKKDYKKATNIAEKIIAITDKYKNKMSFIDRCKYKKLVTNFMKVN